MLETREQDVLAALRAATAERHAELDAHTPLAAPEVDLAAYGAHLRLLERWLAPVPGWLAGFDDGPVLPDYLGAIRADLAHEAWTGAPVATVATVTSAVTATTAATATAEATAATVATATTEATAAPVMTVSAS